MKAKKHFAYDSIPVSTDFVAFWKRYNWWLYCIFVTLAFGLFLYYLHPSTDQDNARYILSAISQGLAAILALVFTITLVVAQMTRRYTAMDKIIFRPETIALMIIFGLGVVTPLLVLKTESLEWGVDLSIAFAVFCVFSLIPFLKSVNVVLKYEFGVHALYKEIMVAIESGNKASVDVEELTEIGEKAVTEAPENTVVTIIRLLSIIGKKCAEKGLGDDTYWVVSKLSDIGVKSVGRRFGEASFFAATGLKDIGVEAAIDGLFEPSAVAIEGLENIGAKAAERGLKKWDITMSAAEGLWDIGMNSEDKTFGVSGLWYLGTFVMEYLPEERCDQVIKYLKKIEKEIEIDRATSMRWAEGSISDSPNLEASFEKFKKRYEQDLS